MHRIIILLSVVSALICSCSLTKMEEPVPEPTPKPWNNEFDAEVTEHLLVSAADEIESLGIGTEEELLNLMLENMAVTEAGVLFSIEKDGETIISALVSSLAEDARLNSITVKDSLEMQATPGIPVLDFYRLILSLPEDISEQECKEITGTFNTGYAVDCYLAGRHTGLLKMRSYQDHGKLLPGFVLDFDEGSSLFLQFELLN